MERAGKHPESAPTAGSSAGAANELVMAGLDIGQALERLLRRRVGLSLNQFNVLRVVAGSAGQAAHGVDLTRVLGLSSAHATTVVNQLEERGLVDREPSVVDRRRRVLTLTSEGRSTLDDARPVVEMLEELVASAVGADESVRLRDQLRQVRLALRHGMTSQDWDDCIGP